MTLIFCVRHGRTATGDDDDPGLSAEGHQQALEMAESLARECIGLLPILSSPSRRCQETAAALAAIWKATVRIDVRAVEFPAPRSAVFSRSSWRRQALAASWEEAGQLGEQIEPGYAAILSSWRDGLVELLLGCERDTVIFTHAFAIKSLIATATGSDRVDLVNRNESLSRFTSDGRRYSLF